MRALVSLFLVIIIVSFMLMGVSEMPEFGAIDAPSNNEVSQKYIEDAIEDTGATNVVAAVILDYRAFDTLIEATVLFSAFILVVIVLKERSTYE